MQAWRELLDKDIKEDHFLKPPFNAWRNLAENRRDSKKQLRNRVSKLDRSSLARSFHAFEELIQDRRRLQSVVARHLQKKDRHLMNRCFQAWISFMQVGCRFYSLPQKFRIDETENMLLHMVLVAMYGGHNRSKMLGTSGKD